LLFKVNVFDKHVICEMFVNNFGILVTFRASIIYKQLVYEM